MPAARVPQSDRRETLGAALLASAVFVLAALRASMGLSFYDDSYYIAVALRLARGARPFVDELSMQSLGELVSVPFLRLYESFVGLAGVALFTRELYVVLAAVAGLIVYRLLRPSARPAAAAIAVILPLLALPYHLFAPTYNTVAQLCFTLSVVLGWASIRDRRRTLAAASGVMLAFGTAAYPPLAGAAVVLLATYAVTARSRRLALSALGGAALVGAAIAAALVFGLSIDDLRRSLAFTTANARGVRAPVGRLRWSLGNLVGALASPWLWPMWTLALVASIPPLPRRLRAAALGAIPLAAAAPGVAVLARSDTLTFGSATSSWMITLTAGIAVPALLWAWRTGSRDHLRLVAHATPFALVGFASVAYATSSSWNRGTGSIALAPLTLGLLLCWSTALAEEWGPSLQWTATLVTLLVAFGLLTTNVFGDPVSSASFTLITKGPYAGITTSAERYREIRALEAAAENWVGPETRVTFLGERDAYLVVGGVWDTPAVRLLPGPSDRAAVERYERRGRPAQVVFVDELALARRRGYRGGLIDDPLLAYVLANYRKVDSAADFSVFVLK